MNRSISNNKNGSIVVDDEERKLREKNAFAWTYNKNKESSNTTAVVTPINTKDEYDQYKNKGNQKIKFKAKMKEFSNRKEQTLELKR